MDRIIGFDIGGTKVAWTSFSPEAKPHRSGRFATPATAEQLLHSLGEIIIEEKAKAVGIGIAGTIKPDHGGTVLCPNAPQFSDLDLARLLGEAHSIPVTVDNDARCALIGEVWKGAAAEYTSCVLVTVGTGIGGAVMQKGTILPHPDDISLEVGRIPVDPTDVFPAKGGSGTVEAFLGGRNLEERLQISLPEQADLVRSGDEEAKEIWHAISYYFIQCMRAVHAEYSCKVILIGGIGSKDLEYYLQDPAPCEIKAASLGGDAGIYGAARLGLDLYEAERVNPQEWE